MPGPANVTAHRPPVLYKHPLERENSVKPSGVFGDSKNSHEIFRIRSTGRCRDASRSHVAARQPVAAAVPQAGAECQTVEQWCKEHHFACSTYYRWEKALREPLLSQMEAEQGCPRLPAAATITQNEPQFAALTIPEADQKRTSTHRSITTAKIPVRPGFADSPQAAEPRLTILAEAHKNHVSAPFIADLINLPGLDAVVQNLLIKKM